MTLSLTRTTYYTDLADTDTDSRICDVKIQVYKTSVPPRVIVAHEDTDYMHQAYIQQQFNLLELRKKNEKTCKSSLHLKKVHDRQENNKIKQRHRIRNAIRRVLMSFLDHGNLLFHPIT